MKIQTRTICCVKKFRKDAKGSVTIEFVMWLPVLFFMLLLVVDASVLFMTQSNYWSVSRDTARLVARHAMTEDAAEDYAANNAIWRSVTPTVTVSIVGAAVTVSMAAPSSSIAPFSILGFAGGSTINASITQTLEPI
ncbi:MAG: TadE/TadG family type IV pilus assembly protein [Paracoccaceae bacterium]